MRMLRAAARFPVDCIRLRSVSRAAWGFSYTVNEGRNP